MAENGITPNSHASNSRVSFNNFDAEWADLMPTAHQAKLVWPAPGPDLQFEIIVLKLSNLENEKIERK